MAKYSHNYSDRCACVECNEQFRLMLMKALDKPLKKRRTRGKKEG